MIGKNVLCNSPLEKLTNQQALDILALNTIGVSSSGRMNSRLTLLLKIIFLGLYFYNLKYAVINLTRYVHR